MGFRLYKNADRFSLKEERSGAPGNRTPLKINSKIYRLNNKINVNLLTMEVNDNKNKKSKPLSIRGIPIIAIIFPPLGLLMLLKYLLNKNKKED